MNKSSPWRRPHRQSETPRRVFRVLKTVPGIGQVLALTIMLETGSILRFPIVGDHPSCCRSVGSQKLSKGKKKGQGNTKNGNKYLTWAFIEAANFAIWFSSRIRSFFRERKPRAMRGRTQGAYIQAVPGLRLHHEESGCVRCRQGVCLTKSALGWDEAVSLYRVGSQPQDLIGRCLSKLDNSEMI